MATPWDRAALGYLEEWVPRFVPYHLDLMHELAVLPGQCVLVPSSGPGGGEVLAAARSVGDRGRVRATDTSDEMVRLCSQQVHKAGFSSIVECSVTDASDTSGGPWDIIACAFSLWQFADCVQTLRAWRDALSEHGKIGIITWGPAEADDPFQSLTECVQELEPEFSVPNRRIRSQRESMDEMFEQAGLVMIRHTVVRHTIAFQKAEDFVRALREACVWRDLWEKIGDERMERLAVKFYERHGGRNEPLTFSPHATVAIAGLPGAEVELKTRSSVRIPIQVSRR